MKRENHTQIEDDMEENTNYVKRLEKIGGYDGYKRNSGKYYLQRALTKHISDLFPVVISLKQSQYPYMFFIEEESGYSETWDSIAKLVCTNMTEEGKEDTLLQEARSIFKCPLFNTLENTDSDNSDLKSCLNSIKSTIVFRNYDSFPANPIIDLGNESSFIAKPDRVPDRVPDSKEYDSRYPKYLKKYKNIFFSENRLIHKTCVDCIIVNHAAELYPNNGWKDLPISCLKLLRSLVEKENTEDSGFTEKIVNELNIDRTELLTELNTYISNTKTENIDEAKGFFFYLHLDELTYEEYLLCKELITNTEPSYNITTALIDVILESGLYSPIDEYESIRYYILTNDDDSTGNKLLDQILGIKDLCEHLYSIIKFKGKPVIYGHNESDLIIPKDTINIDKLNQIERDELRDNLSKHLDEAQKQMEECKSIIKKTLISSTKTPSPLAARSKQNAIRIKELLFPINADVDVKALKKEIPAILKENINFTNIIDAYGPSFYEDFFSSVFQDDDSYQYSINTDEECGLISFLITKTSHENRYQASKKLFIVSFTDASLKENSIFESLNSFVELYYKKEWEEEEIEGCCYISHFHCYYFSSSYVELGAQVAEEYIKTLHNVIKNPDQTDELGSLINSAISNHIGFMYPKTVNYLDYLQGFFGQADIDFISTSGLIPLKNNYWRDTSLAFQIRSLPTKILLVIQILGETSPEKELNVEMDGSIKDNYETNENKNSIICYHIQISRKNKTVCVIRLI